MDGTDAQGRTALHDAASNGDAGITDLLLRIATEPVPTDCAVRDASARTTLGIPEESAASDRNSSVPAGSRRPRALHGVAPSPIPVRCERTWSSKLRRSLRAEPGKRCCIAAPLEQGAVGSPEDAADFGPELTGPINVPARHSAKDIPPNMDGVESIVWEHVEWAFERMATLDDATGSTERPT